MYEYSKGYIDMKKATCLDEIIMAFQDIALTGDDFDDFFVDTSEARGRDVVDEIVYIFNMNKSFEKKILFGGHLGCGKTTELYRVERRLSDDYLVVPFSVKLELDPNKLEYVDLLFAILAKVVEAAKNEKIRIDDSVVSNIIHYWKDQTSVKYVNEIAYNADADVEVKLNWLNTLLAKLKASLKLGGTIREETKEIVESNLMFLISSINEIVDEINKKLSKKNKKILVIVEDLEKLRLDKCKNLFIENRDALVAINLDIIYTFPISLYYSEYFNEISSDFFSSIILSMIKVKERDGNDCAKGISCLKEIVKKRCVDGLIDDDALDFFIKKSGGSIRDLFSMIIRSAVSIRSNANRQNYTSITIEVANEQYQTIVNEKQRSLKKERIPFLKELYHDPDRRPIDNENNDLISLLQSMNVIEYNGVRWCALHPATEDYLLSVNLL